MQDFKINLKKVQSTFIARSSKLKNCTVTPQVVCSHPHSIKYVEKTVTIINGYIIIVVLKAF